MKFKFSVVFSIIIICVVNSLAQERKVEIEVSMDETNILQRAKNIPANVKITNKAKDVLKTVGLGRIKFHFKKCLTCEKSYAFNDIYEAQSGFPAKNLIEDESFEFTVNLAGLYWYSPLQSNLRFDEKDSFVKYVPKENIYFEASIALLKGYKMDRDLKRKVPDYKVFRSNTINVAFK